MMDHAEFNELTRSIFKLLRPRIDQKWIPTIEGMMSGGEYGYVVEELVDIVAEDEIPVSAAELRQLRLLASEMGGDSAKLLAELERVQPKDTALGPPAAFDRLSVGKSICRTRSRACTRTTGTGD